MGGAGQGSKHPPVGFEHRLADDLDRGAGGALFVLLTEGDALHEPVQRPDGAVVVPDVPGDVEHLLPAGGDEIVPLLVDGLELGGEALCRHDLLGGPALGGLAQALLEGGGLGPEGAEGLVVALLGRGAALFGRLDLGAVVCDLGVDAGFARLDGPVDLLRPSAEREEDRGQVGHQGQLLRGTGAGLGRGHSMLRRGFGLPRSTCGESAFAMRTWEHRLKEWSRRDLHPGPPQTDVYLYVGVWLYSPAKFCLLRGRLVLS